MYWEPTIHGVIPHLNSNFMRAGIFVYFDHLYIPSPAHSPTMCVTRNVCGYGWVDVGVRVALISMIKQSLSGKIRINKDLKEGRPATFSTGLQCRHPLFQASWVRDQVAPCWWWLRNKAGQGGQTWRRNTWVFGGRAPKTEGKFSQKCWGRGVLGNTEEQCSSSGESRGRKVGDASENLCRGLRGNRQCSTL